MLHGRRFAQAGVDPDVVLRNMVDQDAPLLVSALADQTLAHLELAAGYRCVSS